ncbi:MAG: AzlD domain-containing protein [Coriobacteriales bacterium]|nr:AzlD domain-containing protein [Coriobacteriales bacterium]
MTQSSFWLVIALAGVGTLLMRALPMLAHGRIAPRPALQRVLAYVPAASLAALVVPGSLLAAGGGYEMQPARVIAIFVATLVAVRFKNVLLTLVVGMSVLWVAQALLP